MRYYELTISGDGGDYILDPNGLGIIQGSGPLASSLYTNQTAGNSGLVGDFNPNALNIEIDLPVTALHQPQGGAAIRLWGIGLRALAQAANLNPVDEKFKTFVLKGGMSKGLPLANPDQAGIIAQGNVYQAFGNWAGINQTLDLVLQPGPLPPAGNAGVSWKWKEGQAIDDAISQTLSQAMPGYKPSINVSKNLIAPNDLPGWYPNFSSWAEAVRTYTKPLGQQLFGKSYNGVLIATSGKNVNVFDGQGPTKPEPKTLAFQDLVGQPTWISGTEVAFQTVMRYDIKIQDEIQFPGGILPPYALTNPEAAAPNTPASSKIAFQGSFVINEMHHYGNYRQADWAAWNTTFKAFVLGSPQAGQ